MIERLTACAIIRNGVTESRGFKAHWEIRAALGDQDPTKPKPDDVEGFMTSEGRFVGRGVAALIGYDAGQVKHPSAPLLSSEVDWDAKRGRDPGQKSDSLKKLLKK